MKTLSFSALPGLFLLSMILSSPVACWALKMPSWVEDPGRDYADSRYLTGVGSGDSRQAAEDSAYAALSRIFRAEIRQWWCAEIAGVEHDYLNAFAVRTKYSRIVNSWSSASF